MPSCGCGQDPSAPCGLIWWGSILVAHHVDISLGLPKCPRCMAAVFPQSSDLKESQQEATTLSTTQSQKSYTIISVQFYSIESLGIRLHPSFLSPASFLPPFLHFPSLSSVLCPCCASRSFQQAEVTFACLGYHETSEISRRNRWLWRRA